MVKYKLSKKGRQNWERKKKNRKKGGAPNKQRKIEMSKIWRRKTLKYKKIKDFIKERGANLERKLEPTENIRVNN